MRVILIVITFALFSAMNAQNSITIIVASEGIAPIPSFSLNQPVVMAFSDLKIYKNLHYMPNVAFNLKDGQGWFMDNWVKYIQPFDTTETWSATVGLNWAPFCQPYNLTNGKKPITQMVRYLVAEVSVSGKFQSDNSQFVSLVYWYNHTLDNDYGVKGHYVSLAYSKTLPLFKNKFSVTGNINPYWIYFSDGAKGFSTSGQLTLTHKRSGLFLSSQRVLPFAKSAGNKNGNISLGIYKEF